MVSRWSSWVVWIKHSGLIKPIDAPPGEDTSTDTSTLNALEKKALADKQNINVADLDSQGLTKGVVAGTLSAADLNTSAVYINGELVGTRRKPPNDYIASAVKQNGRIMTADGSGNKLIYDIESNTWKNLNESVLNEVGASPQHKKFIKNIYKAEENMHKHIHLYKNFLNSQGLKKEANEIGSKYVGIVGKFTHWMKITWTKMVRKMI